MPEWWSRELSSSHGRDALARAQKPFRLSSPRSENTFVFPSNYKKMSRGKLKHCHGA
jgi:hypothetical protein